MKPSKTSSLENRSIALAALLIAFNALFFAFASVPVSAGGSFPTGREASFLESLAARDNEPRAALIGHGPGITTTMYARASRGRVAFFAKLSPKAETLLRAALMKMPRRRLTVKKRDGSVFYEKGFCRSGKIRLAGGAEGEIVYVPYCEAVSPDAPFACDVGKLRIGFALSDLAAGEIADVVIPSLLRAVFREGTAAVLSGREHDALYSFRSGHFGYVDRAAWPPEKGGGFAPALFPTHKLTSNRRVADPAAKAGLDASLAADFLRPDFPIVSQDIRAWEVGVRPEISVKMGSIDQSDIGSGQNTYVYLSHGPGINYFDAPYEESSAGSLPAPRFVFDRRVLYGERCQFFPKNSWECAGRGMDRFREINRFQATLRCAPAAGEEVPAHGVVPAYMPLPVRERYLSELERGIVDYGLLTDTTELLMAFEFAGERHRGNLINNEIRISDAVYPAFDTLALIVPPGTAKRYAAGCRRVAGECGHPGFVSGVRIEDYLIEAPEASERGMRMAYLEFLVSRFDRGLYCFLKLSRAPGGLRPGYFALIRACERMIRREGPAFFTDARRRRTDAAFEKLRVEYARYLGAIRRSSSRSERKDAFERYGRAYREAMSHID